MEPEAIPVPAKLSPLTRHPDIKFRDVKLMLHETPTPFSGGAELLGTVMAIADLSGWAPTPIQYRLIRVNDRLLVGQRCGYLHMPHFNARYPSAETLWCTHCWVDPSGTGKGSFLVPFYLYYRHYDDHVLYHLPACDCGKRFQVWDSEEPLKDGYAYVFSAYLNPSLLREVDEQLRKDTSQN